VVLIIGITGATGVIYGIRLLEVLSRRDDIETHLIISEAGELTIKYETDRNIEDIKKLATHSYNIGDISACLSSGTFKRDGMVILPCSVKTLSALANSYCDNLIIRSADVTLKERKKLVVAFRESPLHLGHIRNMEQLTEMGAILMPPVPSFYNNPKTIEDIIDHTVGKVLDMFDTPHNLYKPWAGCT